MQKTKINIEPSIILIEYETYEGISLRFYEEGFLDKEIEITNVVQDYMIERLKDKNDLQIRDEFMFKKEEVLWNIFFKS